MLQPPVKNPINKSRDQNFSQFTIPMDEEWEFSGNTHRDRGRPGQAMPLPSVPSLSRICVGPLSPSCAHQRRCQSAQLTHAG